MQVRPFRRASAITPHDTNPSITGSPTGVYVGGAGAIACTLSGATATTVTFAAVPVGTTLFIELNSVLATGTTATNLLALYE